MFFAQPGELSDDELDPDEEMEEERPRQSAHHDAAAAESSSKTNSSSAVSKEKDSNTTSSGSPIKTEVKEESCDTTTLTIDVTNTNESSFFIALQVFFPFFAAGLGTVAAGLLLDHVQVEILKFINFIQSWKTSYHYVYTIFI